MSVQAAPNHKISAPLVGFSTLAVPVVVGGALGLAAKGVAGSGRAAQFAIGLTGTTAIGAGVATQLLPDGMHPALSGAIGGAVGGAVPAIGLVLLAAGLEGAASSHGKWSPLKLAGGLAAGIGIGGAIGAALGAAGGGIGTALDHLTHR